MLRGFYLACVSAIAAATSDPCMGASGLQIISDLRSGTQVARASADWGVSFETRERTWDALGRAFFADPPIGPPPVSNLVESTVPGPLWGTAEARAGSWHVSTVTALEIKIETTSRVEARTEFPTGACQAQSTSHAVLRFSVDLPGRYSLNVAGGASQEWCNRPRHATASCRVAMTASNGETIYDSSQMLDDNVYFQHSQLLVLRPGLQYTLTVTTRADLTLFARGEGLHTTNYSTGATAWLSLPPAASCPADFNRDTVVDQVDLLMLLDWLGDPPGPTLRGDLSLDGLVNTVDLALLLSVYNTSCN